LARFSDVDGISTLAKSANVAYNQHRQDTPAAPATGDPTDSDMSFIGIELSRAVFDMTFIKRLLFFLQFKLFEAANRDPYLQSSAWVSATVADMDLKKKKMPLSATSSSKFKELKLPFVGTVTLQRVAPCVQAE